MYLYVLGSVWKYKPKLTQRASSLVPHITDKSQCWVHQNFLQYYFILWIDFYLKKGFCRMIEIRTSTHLWLLIIKLIKSIYSGDEVLKLGEALINIAMWWRYICGFLVHTLLLIRSRPKQIKRLNEMNNFYKII